MYNIHFICNGMVLYAVYNCMVNIPYCTSYNICLLYSYKLALYIIVDSECQDLSNINLYSIYRIGSTLETPATVSLSN